MTRYTVRELSNDDGSDLLSLSRLCNTGSEAFSVDRSPDFFAWGRALGSTRYHGVFEAGALLGSIGVTAQHRYLDARPTLVNYVHDLRVHPAHCSPRVVSTLLGHAFEAHRVDWCFATILDSNPHQRFIVRAAARYFGAKRPIGHTAHLGWPLFRFGSGRATPFLVRESSEREWEAHYRALASRTEFASAEASHWRSRPGTYLTAYRGGEVHAVAKAISGNVERRIIVARAPGSALLRALSAFALRAPLPAPGAALPHGHLGFLMCRAGADPLDPFRAFLCGHSDAAWSWLFTGADASRQAPAPRFGVRFTSTTYAFGKAPARLEMKAHELTLV